MKKVQKLIWIWVLLLGALACNLPGLSTDQDTPEPGLPPTQVIIPTATNTPLPTATPTPVPAARVARGDQAIFYGDYEKAFAEYETALGTSSDKDIQYAAGLGLARTHFLVGELSEAQSILAQLIASEEDSPLRAEALFLFAQTEEGQGNYHSAVEVYQQYLDLRPGIIESYVAELQGDLLSAAGDYPAAISAYQAALASPRLDSYLDTEFKMARAYESSGDLATAIVAYQDIYSRSSSDFLRAQLDYLLGQAYLAVGETEPGQAAYLDAVMNYPRSYNSYLALVELVEAGVEVNEFQRGLVDYYAGQYAVAIAAFDRYLLTEPADAAVALYYKGLSQSGLGEHQAAIETWGEIIQNHPDAPLWADAWEEIAELLWYQGADYQGGIDTLLEFVDQVPAHPNAADFLFQAASIAERGEELDQAAKIWERMASEYPSAESANRAIFLAGITRYRLADFMAAEELFQKLLAMSSDLEDRSAAYFWIGKSRQAQGEEEAAQAAWQQAAVIDPTGYYSERAKDILAGIEIFSPPLEYDFTFDVRAEQNEAEDWIKTIFGLPEETDLSQPGPLRDDPRFLRGNEFWRLGLYEEARAEFEDLRISLGTDPANSYRLGNHMLELGLYRPAIFAMRQVLDQAGMDDAETMSAPIYFNHVRFGTYYRDLILPASQEYNFHPLFILSVMRQESLFEGFVRSSAGARGLMQIIPTTGQEVAANAGWPPDYSDEDLYRPLVSVNLGSNYLNRQRGFMSGDLYGALAAYNAGPGNAATWRDLVPPDPDLYVEVIRFSETRNYIRGIYEIFSIYRNIYDRTP